MKLLLSVFALLTLGCSAFSHPSYVPDDFPPDKPPTVATWTPPRDAHGCSEQDWNAAYTYRRYAKSARENEQTAATLEIRDRKEHLAKLEALDDRKDLDAKVERHFLEEGDDNADASNYRSVSRWDESMAEQHLGIIAPKCREWLEKDGR